MSSIKAVIFDLDGVILSTDNLHYLAWKKMTEREGVEFDRDINERLRGVSRMESLAIILEKSAKVYSEEEKVRLAEFKNEFYKKSLASLSPGDVYPGVVDFLDFLESKGIKIAVGSSSKNSKSILRQVGLYHRFEGAISDGTNISKSKPDPEVFLKAAEMVGVEPSQCLVIEDAAAGIEAAKAGGMLAMGVEPSADHPQVDYSAKDIQSIDKTIFN